MTDAQAYPPLEEGPDRDEQPYQPISAYAAIGDCHGSALVARTGSVDWCCLGRFDAEPVLCRLLDRRKGGFLSLRPRPAFSARRRYLGRTNVLETTFESAAGTVRVTDFMPVGRREGAATHDYVSLTAPGWLIRLVEGVSGRLDLEIAYRPSRDFARRPARLSTAAGEVRAEGAPTLYVEAEMAIRGDLARGHISVGAGERYAVVLAMPADGRGSPLSRVPELLAITRHFWQEWISYCRYDGPYRDAVRRSALALKLLSYAPSGAIVAALTTSLPEEIGGIRNWDYRYCWLRDSCFTLYALSALGYGGEARRFSGFLRKCCAERIQIMYGLEGEEALSEERLDHLEGYRGSRPVRTGNAAYEQRQNDVFGQIMDWALLYKRVGGKVDGESRALLHDVANFVRDHWHEADQGLWEMRGPPRHHVHGKVMSWVAMDRALALFGPSEGWQETRAAIEKEVLERGIDAEGGHFVQAYGGGEVDAALLLLPMVGFPMDRGLLERTVAAIERELGADGLLKRYRGDDGLEGSEGAFLICGFWWVDALLCLGRHDDARRLFERLLAAANDVGLYSEEIAPATGEFLGNFPQAFTHLALIGNAINFQIYERHGPAALVGSYADRARYGVSATFGWRALWEAAVQSGRVGRLWPSRKSVLPDRLII